MPIVDRYSQWFATDQHYFQSIDRAHHNIHDIFWWTDFYINGVSVSGFQYTIEGINKRRLSRCAADLSLASISFQSPVRSDSSRARHHNFGPTNRNCFSTFRAHLRCFAVKHQFWTFSTIFRFIRYRSEGKQCFQCHQRVQWLTSSLRHHSGVPQDWVE